MDVLVTGCQGFVGHAVCAAFHAAGHRVTGVDIRAGQQEPWRTVQSRVDQAEFQDILRRSNAQVLVHAAGTASVADSFQDPGRDFDGSVVLLRHVLEAARLAPRKPRVFYLSSASVYGSPSVLPIPETAPIQPLSPYGIHRAMCEMLAESYGLAHKVDSVGLRLFSLLGPRQRRLLVHELASQVLAGATEIRIEGTGEEARDYLFVDDVGSALVQLASTDAALPPLLNLSSGQQTRVADLAHAVARAYGVTCQVICEGKPQRGNPAVWHADVSRVRGVLPGFSPTPLGTALEVCLNAWLPSKAS